jgi:hypothetical protein
MPLSGYFMNQWWIADDSSEPDYVRFGSRWPLVFGKVCFGCNLVECCHHLSGLLTRRIVPLAVMQSAWARSQSLARADHARRPRPVFPTVRPILHCLALGGWWVTAVFVGRNGKGANRARRSRPYECAP